MSVIHYRLVGACNGAWITAENPRGLNPLLAAGDVAAFLAESVTPGLGFWLHAPAGIVPDYTIGQFEGRNVICAYAPVWEALGTVFPTALLRAVTDAKRAEGLRSVVYGGSIRGTSLLPPNNRGLRRTHAIDRLIQCVIDCGFDALGLDAAAVTTPPCDSLHLARRAAAKGLEVIVEPRGPVCPDLFEWNTGEFSTVSSYNAQWTWGETGEAGPDGYRYFGRACPRTSLRNYVAADLSIDAAVRLALLSSGTAGGYSAVIETQGVILP